MAIIKHVTSKNMSYNDVLDYFTYKHREDPERGSYEPILDEYGLLQERENCTTVSDKARAIAGGVLEALLHLAQERGLTGGLLGEG